MNLQSVLNLNSEINSKDAVYAFMVTLNAVLEKNKSLKPKLADINRYASSLISKRK